MAKLLNPKGKELTTAPIGIKSWENKELIITVGQFQILLSAFDTNWLTHYMTKSMREIPDDYKLKIKESEVLDEER